MDGLGLAALKGLKMCQAFEAESNYMRATDRWLREKGYNAQKLGAARDTNPESDHENPEYSHKRQWWLGWDTAAAGREKW